MPWSLRGISLKVAEWMIIIEIGCCLRPLGIVVNEQHRATVYLFYLISGLTTMSCFHYDICSFIMSPYGRVHAASMMIIHGVIRLA